MGNRADGPTLCSARWRTLGRTDRFSPFRQSRGAQPTLKRTARHRTVATYSFDQHMATVLCLVIEASLRTAHGTRLQHENSSCPRAVLLAPVLGEDDVCANAAHDGDKETNPNVLPDIRHARPLPVKAVVSATTRSASQDSLPKFRAPPQDAIKIDPSRMK